MKFSEKITIVLKMDYLEHIGQKMVRVYHQKIKVLVIDMNGITKMESNMEYLKVGIKMVL